MTREQRSERAALPRRDRRYVIETARERASAKGEERGERGGNLSRNFFFLPVNVCGGCVAFGRTPVYLSLAALSVSPPSLASSLFLGWSAHKFSRFSTFISFLPSLPASQGDSLCAVQCTRFVLHLLNKKTFDKTWLQAMSQLADGYWLKTMETARECPTLVTQSEGEVCHPLTCLPRTESYTFASTQTQTPSLFHSLSLSSSTAN